MRRIAYIPARGGSKGIPGKNIREVSGKPLIAYTILAARATSLFDMVFVSTDSPEIAEIARAYGAEVPFLRDPSVAQDTTRTIDTVVSDKARLEQLMGGERGYDVFVLLQPTSPLRGAEDIVGAVRLFEENGLNCGGVVSISKVSEHPILMRTLDLKTHQLTSILPGGSTVRRQDMPSVYKVNGAIYVNAWNALTPSLSLNDNRLGYVMAEGHAIDIDAPKDLELVRAILRQSF